MNRKNRLLNVYDTLLDRLGPSRWWPGDGPFEVAVGAILTQNTNWNNVVKALDNLKARGLMEPGSLYETPPAVLSELIRPAGYYRLKASRLRNFLEFLKAECDFEIETLASRDREKLRAKLLEVKGIGPETADSILLYALGFPSFVVDAYTARILSRHGWLPEEATYREIQEYFMDALDPDPALYNEYHALIVRTAKNWCKKSKALCSECPLETYLP
jgi:endonuclease-3 related protein